MSPQERDLLAAEHALGLLEGDRERAAETAAAHDPAYAEALSRWREHFAEFDATAAPLPPPPALWTRIAGSLADEPVAASPAPAPRRVPLQRPRPWHNLSLWRGLAGASAMAALLLAGIALRPPAAPTLVAVLLTDANRPAAIVNAYADGHAELVPIDPVAVPPDRALQVWTLWDRERGPVSIGLLDAARVVRLDLARLPRTGPSQLFEITLEPRAGSPTGRPTGPILMKGLADRVL